MTTKEFSQTPLFQLNLLIYLCWRSNSVLRPVFIENGYELYFIGKKIPVNPEILTQASRTNPATLINKLVSPDLILRNNHEKTLIPIECKENSFGPNSDNSQQARALLTLTGNSLGQYFGFSNPDQWKSKIIYVVGEDKSGPMLRTLDSITDDLRANKFNYSDFYSLEITINPDGIYLQCPNDRPCATLGIEQSIKVMNLESGESPTFLYIIPIDPDVNLQNEYEQLEFKERIRTGIASMIGMRLNQKNFSIQDEELYKSIVEVWDYWDNSDSKKALRSQIGKYLNKVIDELRKLGLIIVRDGNSIICKNVDKPISKKVRNYFLSEKYMNGNIELDFEGQLPFEFYYDKTISHPNRRG